MTGWIELKGRRIGAGNPVYVVAEMSANHNQSYDHAVKIIEAAKECGADAIKLQTYTPDTITIDCDNEHFQLNSTIWEGKNLYGLYGEAYTPWDWQPKLKRVAEELGLELFSTPFDPTAVDFLEEMGVAVHKVASFEVVDIPLLKKIGTTGKPVIMSTGMASLAEIEEAVETLKQAGCPALALLKCTSSYPALPGEMNLRTIAHLAETFGLPVGLSDHTPGSAVPVAAVALGACIVEKHFTLDRSAPGPDNAFSMEPREFKEMVSAIRVAEQALGEIHYNPTEKERQSKTYRRSLFVVRDIRAGEEFTPANVRSIRPATGLHTRFLEVVMGRRAARDIARGTPLDWELIG